MNNKLYDKLIFELSRPGRRGFKVNGAKDAVDAVENALPAHLLRSSLSLPEADEPTVVRHYTNMSTNNFGVDTGFYPLGSCTMKYNPKINEALATCTPCNPRQRHKVPCAPTAYCNLLSAASVAWPSSRSIPTPERTAS